MDPETAFIHRLYTKERLSLRQIGEQINRDHHYIKRRLESLGVLVVKYNKPRKTVATQTRPRYAKICEVCDTPYQTPVGDQRFCSHHCRGQAIISGIVVRRNISPLILKVCPQCDQEFTHKAYQSPKYCCRRCFEIAHSVRMAGTNNPSYKNGSSYNKPSFRGEDWGIIRQRIYKRDNFTCQDCGSRCIGKDAAKPENTHLIIQCHHIRPYDTPEDNGDDNLVTLCLRCHIGRHNPNPAAR